MPRGGRRAGAGRPRKGQERPRKPKAPKLALPIVGTPGASPRVVAGRKNPLEYMLDVMNDPGADEKRRDYMAVAAAPYMHPKVEKGKKQEKQEGAERAAAGRFAPAPPPGALKTH